MAKTLKADDFKPGWRRVTNAENQKPVTLSQPPWEKDKDSDIEHT